MTYETYLRLVNELRRHAYEYHVLDQPIISDSEYDLLFRRMLDWEEQNPELVHPNSPTKMVAGGSRAIGVLYPHKVPMLSIDNVFDYADFQKWLRTITKRLGHMPELVMEFKYDGLAVSLVYEAGQLVRALTRNDGSQGEDVTENVLAIGTIPVTIEGEFNGEIRGEVVVPRDIFERLNDSLIAAGQQAYANCRNAAAGMLRRGTTSLITNLAFIPYAVIEHDTDANLNQDTYMTQREWLRQVCPCLIDENDPTFVITGGDMAPEITLSNFAGFLDNFDDRRGDFPVDTDGVVIKCNRPDDIRALGHGTRVVKWATAYKFNALNRKTTLRDIVFQVGRTGLVTPVAELEPVELNGVMVDRATMHNVEQMDGWDVRVGNLVAIERAGDVIPYITDIIPVEDNMNPLIKAPAYCPCCESKLTTGRNSNGIYCPNTACTGRRLAWFLNATARDALDVKGLGPAILGKLLAFDPQLTIPKLFNYSKESHQTAAGLGTVEAENLYSELQDKRHTTFTRALIAGGFNSVGKVTAQRIADVYANCESPMHALLDTLQGQPGAPPLDPKYIELIKSTPDWEDTLLSMLFLRFTHNTPSIDASGINDERIIGKSFCITGSVPGYPREHIAAHLQAAGGVFKTGVSRHVDYLFYGHDAGGKLKKAQDIGVNCIDLTNPAILDEWKMLFDF